MCRGAALPARACPAPRRLCAGRESNPRCPRSSSLSALTLDYSPNLVSSGHIGDFFLSWARSRRALLLCPACAARRHPHLYAGVGGLGGTFFACHLVSLVRAVRWVPGPVALPVCAPGVTVSHRRSATVLVVPPRLVAQPPSEALAGLYFYRLFLGLASFCATQGA